MPSVACPHCGHITYALDSVASRAVSCPQCRRRFHVPLIVAADEPVQAVVVEERPQRREPEPFLSIPRFLTLRVVIWIAVLLLAIFTYFALGTISDSLAIQQRLAP